MPYDILNEETYDTLNREYKSVMQDITNLLDIFENNKINIDKIRIIIKDMIESNKNDTVFANNFRNLNKKMPNIISLSNEASNMLAIVGANYNDAMSMIYDDQIFVRELTNKNKNIDEKKPLN